MKLLRLVFVLQALILFSCGPSDEELQRQNQSRYEGKWIGSFDGDDKGELVFTVTNAGNFTGSLTSQKLGNSEEFAGYVQANGKFAANTRSGFIFNAQLTNFENSTGQWSKTVANENLKGTFRVQKK